MQACKYDLKKYNVGNRYPPYLFDVLILLGFATKIQVPAVQEVKNWTPFLSNYTNDVKKLVKLSHEIK